MSEIVIPFQKLSDKAKVPSQATFSDAGYDLYATENCIIKAGERKLCKTNIATAIPHGYYGRVAPRSGLAYKYGIDVLAGVIDSGYRGDIGVILINFGTEDFSVNEGDKIAQFIIEKCHYVEWKEVSELPESQRGEGARGSTGTK
ncbi:MAG: dUTP diphosphatase [candidate division SR1 bacterium]|nr:dUTP diphosphatase [candidate division SR1 bacterium]